MSKPSPLNEQEQADLVAYLDGEMAGEEARALETRLSRDATIRAEADALKQAWDLLDYLPKPEPSPNFTHRTLERIAPVQTAAVRPPAVAAGGSFWRPLLLGVGWAACLILAAVGGYLAFERLIPPTSPSSTPTSVVTPQSTPVPQPEVVPGRPVRLSDFPEEVQTYVSETLWPLLTKDERDQLTQAQGTWPLYEHALRRLAHRHEVLPPAPGRGEAKSYETLPPEWQSAYPLDWMRKHKQLGPMRTKEKKWPEFALWITEMSRTHAQGGRPRTSLPPLGACRPKDFSPAVQTFLDKQLASALTPEEKKALTDSEGKSPEYPRLLVRLAKLHRLTVPGMMPPEF